VATFGTTIGSGGLRFYDSGHEVSYNYVAGVYGGNFQQPLMLDSGDAEGSSTALDAHWRVINALVERNVLVGNPTGIVIGHNYSLAPSGCTVRDNVVAQAANGVAVFQKIAPVSTTLTNNAYASTPPAAGLAQDSLSIWRRAGVGPRLTYLQSADVGIGGDPSDTDGTGTLVTGGGGGTTPPPVVDDGTAATKFGWGSPLPLSDEFEYSGAPDSTKWSVYNGPGHDGNGTRSPAQVAVTGGKMVLSGAAGSAASAGLENKVRQQYGRWEVRMRTAQAGSSGATQTLGVGGIATPSGAILATSDQAGTSLTITTSGTSSSPRVYDGQGKKIGRVTFSGCQYVVVQNYLIQSGNQYGVVFDGASNCTLQNCDISDVRVSGDGDLNAITIWGGNANKIRYNTAINYVSGDPGGSHTDWIQTWVSSSHPNAATNYEIVGNKAIGPANPSRDNAVPSIHQWIMVEGAGRGGNSGGSGNPSGWFVAENEVGDSWNQAVKLDGGTNFTFTRNRFVGSSDKVFDLPSASGYQIYSDNEFSSSYGSVGGTITNGAGPATPGGSSGGSGSNNYHPVLIIWPDSERWPEDGEYDWVELSQPGQQSLTAFMHYPHDPGPVQQVQFSKAGVDTSVFHNYAFEWAPTGLVGYVDGAEWFRTAGGATSTRRDIQTMPSGHLTVQLDAFASTSMIPATMELEWSRVYSLTPSGPTTGAQTVTATGIASAERIGIATITGAAPAPQPGSTPTVLGTAVLGIAQLGFTAPGGGGGPLPGGQSVTGAGGIAYTRAFGVPALSVEDGPQTIIPGSVTSAEAFGRPRLVGGASPAPAPGGVLVPTLFAVAADGQTLTPLPFWTKISISPVRNSPGSLSIEYPAGAPGFSTLHDGVSASPLKALEIRVWLGGNATGALGGWLVQKAGDDLEPGSSWTFSGHFHEWILSKALVFPQAISDANKNGSLRFAGANAGLILGTLLSQAQARGALPLITRDFTNTLDSNGVPWAKSVSSLAFAPKTTVAQVADKCVELGMCEYEVTAGRVWRAYNPGSRGVDRTTGASPLTFAHAVNLSEHSRRESAKDAGTAVLAAGAEGFYASASSPTAQAELGWRAEVAADAGQIASADGVQAAAATYLEIARAGVAEYAASVEFTPGSPLPLLDYGVGDWAYTWAGNRRRRLRIAQLVLEFSADQAPSGRVALNDLITDKLSALYLRLNAIATGDAVVGTSNPTPGGTGEDTIPPAAPIGVTVSSTIAYQIPGEAVVRALVDVGWQPVTTNAYPDAAAAGKAQAAGLIAARIRSGQTYAEDWTWSGAPAVVGLYAAGLKQEWASAPTNPGDSREPGDTLTIAALLDWLEAYATTAQGGGTITDDVAQYRVQYRYLGAQPIGQGSGDGGLPPDWQPTTPRDPTEQTASAGWFEPTESPTTSSRLTFGEVIGGRSIGVRVAAVDRSGNQGPWSVVVAATSAIDDQPPPKPSKPIATAWFETANVTWDGKGDAGEDLFAAASDLASGGRVEVHMGQGIDFTPDRPPAGDGKSVDLGTSTTYQTDFLWAGTTNITAIPRGVTVYFRFVAVDRNGNASDPSDTSDGVLSQKLVNIQFGPDAIDRLQIRNGAIGSAEIDLLAVNDAHISNISVGKLTAGTMNAQVVIGGEFQTPLTNGNQIRINAAGFQMYRNNTVVGRWQVFDGSMLMTGQYQSNLTGPRVVINPGGSNPDTIRFYPSLSETFSSIDSVDFNGGNTAGIRIVGSGTRARWPTRACWSSATSTPRWCTPPTSATGARRSGWSRTSPETSRPRSTWSSTSGSPRSAATPRRDDPLRHGREPDQRHRPVLQEDRVQRRRAVPLRQRPGRRAGVRRRPDGREQQPEQPAPRHHRRVVHRGVLAQGQVRVPRRRRGPARASPRGQAAALQAQGRARPTSPRSSASSPRTCRRWSVRSRTWTVSGPPRTAPSWAWTTRRSPRWSGRSCAGSTTG
jgi:hypothetical protein